MGQGSKLLTGKVSKTWLLAWSVVAAIGLETALVGVYTAQTSNLRAFTVAVLSSAAAGVVGMFGGFLFGLPRYSRSVTVEPPAPGQAEKTPVARIPAQNYVPSNNLEQVSDWLTKILLGAGLVQLASLGRWFNRLTSTVAAAMTDSTTVPDDARVLAGSLLVLNLGIGFPVGYVLTTLWYRKKLNRIV